MNAELLRRAAKTLRLDAEAAQHVAPRPWSIGCLDPEPDRGVWSDGDELPLLRVYEHCATPTISSYVALMHPPVGLAIARLLQTISWMPSVGNPTDLLAAVAASRAVLREEP